MLGMGSAKRLLLPLRTGFAAALVPIRGGMLSVKRVQGLDPVASCAGLHSLTGFAGVHQTVRVTPVAIKLVECLVLATGMATLHHDVAAIALPVKGCYNRHGCNASREGLLLGRVTLSLAARVIRPSCFTYLLRNFSR
jgi:hypothetical protein